MNPEQLQQKIAEYYSKLPPKVQEVFSKMEWLERLQGISLRYNLTETQIQTLGTETSLVMLGVIHPDEYEQTLMTELAVPRSIGLRIIDDINLEILEEWKVALGETYEKNAREIADKTYGEGKTADERFSSLPKEIQDAISSSNYQNSLMEIGKKNGLNIELMGKLDTVTTKMMLGTIHPEEYSLKIAESLGMPREKADVIAQEVNERILKSIRSALIAHTDSIRKSEAPEPKVPMPPYKKPEPVIVQEQKVPEPSVPLPNYTKIEIPKAPATLPIENSDKVLHTAGIELVNDLKNNPLPEPKPMTEQAVEKDEQALSKSGINLIEKNVNINTTPSGTRSQMLSNIENPPNVSSSIIGAKLGGIVANNAGTGAPHGGDKYREEI
jgi:hypothetical protein